MANVLAVISQSGFRDIEREHGAIALGQVTPLTAYHSKHKRLAGLTDGGSLFAVTVREGRLWLLAILENPSFDGSSWTAPPNRVPVVDISALVPQLRFESGKGLTAPPDKWAMSLQTPRELTSEDVVLLRAQAQPSPGTAYHAAMVRRLEAREGGERRGKKGKGPVGTKAGRPTPRAARSGRVPWTEALSSVAAWTSLDSEARASALRTLAEAVNSARGLPDQRFEPSPHAYGVARLGALTHHPSGLEFLVVPGGQLLMGYSADDILAVFSVLAAEQVSDLLHGGISVMAPFYDACRPPRPVAVSPFLVCRSRVGAPSLVEATGLGEGDDVMEAMRRLGFRLPSEAEWEWLAREGGAVQFVNLPVDQHPLGPTLVPPVNPEENGWGVMGLLDEPEDLADGWHDTYLGAPPTSAAWEPELGPGVARSGHTYWQDTEEAMGLHAANRMRGDSAGEAPRLALDLPESVLPDAPLPSWESTVDDLFAALIGRNRVNRERALCALACQSGQPGEDTALLAQRLLVELGAVAAAVRPEAVRWLAEAAQSASSLPDHPLSRVLNGQLDVALGLLADKKPAVRGGASRLVGAATSDLAAVRRRLLTELDKERRHSVRAGLLLALVQISRRQGAPVPELDDYLGHKDAHVRAAAALAMVEVRGEAAIAGEVLTQLAAAAGVSALPPTELPWYGGQLGQRAFELVQDAPVAVREAGASALLPRIADGQWDAAQSAVQLLFEAQQGHVQTRTVLEVEALSPMQRVVAEALCKHDHFTRGFLGDYGLPDLLEDRLKWLGLAAPSGADRLVTVEWEGTERPWPVWRWHGTLLGVAFMAQWPTERWEAEAAEVVAQLSPVEQLALAFDVHRHRFRSRLRTGGGGSLGTLRPFAEPQAVMEAALAHDAAGSRAAAEAWVRSRSELGGHRRHLSLLPFKVLALTLEAGEVLPTYVDEVYPVREDVPRELLEATPGDRLEAVVYREALERLARLHPGWQTGTEPALKALAPALPYALSPRIAKAVLALGAAGNKWGLQLATKTLAPWGERPEIAAVFHEIEGWKPIDTVKKARQLVAEVLDQSPPGAAR